MGKKALSQGKKLKRTLVIGQHIIIGCKQINGVYKCTFTLIQHCINHPLCSGLQFDKYFPAHTALLEMVHNKSTSQFTASLELARDNPAALTKLFPFDHK